MTEVLKILNKQLTDLGLNYEFGQMSKTPPKYPYWVGEYTEGEPFTEDGLETATIFLNGFARGKFLELEQQKELVKEYFKHDVSAIADSGAAVVISWAGSLAVPSDDNNLKRLQINLQIKKWSV